MTLFMDPCRVKIVYQAKQSTEDQELSAPPCGHPFWICMKIR